MLNIRSLLFYLMVRKKFEESGLYLSDISLFFFQNKLLIKLSFYDSLNLELFKVRRFTRKLSVFKFLPL